MQNRQIKDIKDLPEKYRHVLDDNNKNGKPDFFEGSPLSIIKEVINLFTQKDSQNYNYQKINPSGFQIVIFFIILGLIAIFAVQFFPIIIFILIAYFGSKKKSQKIKQSSTQKIKTDLKQTVDTSKTGNLKYPQNPTDFNPADKIEDHLSNWIRIILLIGLIAYCVYFPWSYLGK